MPHPGALALRVEPEQFPYEEPFGITGHTMLHNDVVTVILGQDAHSGRGEASGVFHHPHDDAAGILRQIEQPPPAIENGIASEIMPRLLLPVVRALTSVSKPSSSSRLALRWTQTASGR